MSISMAAHPFVAEKPILGHLWRHSNQHDTYMRIQMLRACLSAWTQIPAIEAFMSVQLTPRGRRGRVCWTLMRFPGRVPWYVLKEQSPSELWDKPLHSGYGELRIPDAGDLFMFDGGIYVRASNVEPEISRIFLNTRTAVYIGIALDPKEASGTFKVFDIDKKFRIISE